MKERGKQRWEGREEGSREDRIPDNIRAGRFLLFLPRAKSKTSILFFDMFTLLLPCFIRNQADLKGDVSRGALTEIWGPRPPLMRQGD